MPGQLDLLFLGRKPTNGNPLRMLETCSDDNTLRAMLLYNSHWEGYNFPSEDETQGPLCFYDVLADYFVREPENGNPVLDLIIQLWSQSFASHIFSLLFHKWVCCDFTAFVGVAEIFLPAV
ncbi:hypothetical protein C3L33_06935, partial [Rhododendron williamsianum]